MPTQLGNPAGGQLPPPVSRPPPSFPQASGATLAAVLLLLPPGAASPRSDSLPCAIPVPSVSPLQRGRIAGEGPAGPGGTKEPETRSIHGKRQRRGRGSGHGSSSWDLPGRQELCPKPRLSRSRGHLPALEPEPSAAPGTPRDGRRQEPAGPFTSAFRSEEMENQKVSNVTYFHLPLPPSLQIFTSSIKGGWGEKGEAKFTRSGGFWSLGAGKQVLAVR